MGLVPPPKPLMKEEFLKAWDEGKRTLSEIDPTLWKWSGWYARWRYKKRKVNA